MTTTPKEPPTLANILNTGDLTGTIAKAQLIHKRAEALHDQIITAAHAAEQGALGILITINEDGAYSVEATTRIPAGTAYVKDHRP